ncbi:MAG: cytochrome c3 family protein [Verrucomicrobiota bacterium]
MFNLRKLGRFRVRAARFNRHYALFLALLISLSLFGVALSSCSTPRATVLAPLEIPGATFVGNRACADCHAPILQKFPASIHARVHYDREKLPGGTSCETCHGPASKHVAAGGGRGKFILNPGRDSAACLQCHLETQAEFQLPHHHPVLESKMNCVQCHDPHGSDIFKTSGGLAMARQNENCAQCHREQTRPFVFEHEAMREGCTVCHNPHGSINRKLLAQNDSNLCLRCHAQVQGRGGNVTIGKVPHTDLLSRGTCWTSGCHSSIHGSNIESLMRY